jgi:hypothetical protein
MNTDELILAQFESIRKENLQAFEHIADVLQRLEAGNERFDKIEKSIEQLSILHSSCKIRSQETLTALEFIEGNKQKLEKMVENHDNIAETGKAVKKNFIDMASKGLIAFVFLAFGIGATALIIDNFNLAKEKNKHEHEKKEKGVGVKDDN